VVGIKNTVDNEICKGEEEARNSSWVGDEFFATEEGVENEPSIWKGRQRCKIG
jgi:hypothetical protein